MALTIAIISDTHLPRGERQLPEACAARLRSADLILHAGDISTVETLGELRALGAPVEAVAGNVDEEILRSSLPPVLELELSGVRIAMTHDAGPAKGRLERMRRRFPTAAVVIFGHSHIPLHESRGDFQIFNPGSPTDRRRQPEHSMGIIQIERGTARLEHVWLGS